MKNAGARGLPFRGRGRGRDAEWWMVDGGWIIEN